MSLSAEGKACGLGMHLPRGRARACGTEKVQRCVKIVERSDQPVKRSLTNQFLAAERRC